MKDETEWIETVENGWNILVGVLKEKILDGIINFIPNESQNNIFGDGSAAKKICRYIENYKGD